MCCKILFLHGLPSLILLCAGTLQNNIPTSSMLISAKSESIGNLNP
jgi:hypothetical protein